MSNRVIKCDNCGKDFEMSEVQFTRYLKNPEKHNFCSKSCSAKFNAKTGIYKNNGTKIRDEAGHFVKATYKVTSGTCTNCGKLFELSETQKKNINKNPDVHIFCSKSCSAKYSNSHRSDAWKEQSKKTSLFKYGEEHYVNKEQISKSVKKLYETRDDYGFNSDVYKQKMIEKYGVDNIGKSKWMKEHNLEKYGTEYYMQSDDFKNKTKVTNRNKYGVEWHMQNPEQVERYRNTVRERYGVEWITDVPEVHDKIKQSLINTYSAGFTQNRFVSKVNQQFLDILNNLGIHNEHEVYVHPYFYDIKVGNVLIEINPTISHNVTYNVFGGDIKYDYHKNKSLVAREAGYRCIHIFDWDNIDKIIDNLLPRKLIYARNLILQEVSKDDAKQFLDEYHYQCNCRGQKILLGLYKDNELIQVMTFGKPRYNKNYEWELLRLCTKPKFNIVGGAERLFKHFIETYKVNSIISYCDLSKFDGNVYERLGFIKISTSKPRLHWYNMKTRRHITDNLLKQRGFSQLHNDNNYERYKKGDSNKKLMLENGYVEVYDCGQATYVYEKK